MPQKLIKYLNKEEFAKLFSAEKDKKYKLIYTLGFGSGLRISEIVGLKNKDGSWKIKPLEQEQVNLQTHQIKVFGKGSKERITCTSPGLNKTNIRMLPIKIPRRTIQHHLAQLSNKVLGKRISPHTLRHGFGNYMVNEKNLAMPLVQAMMGHSRIDTTGIYTKANPKQATDAGWGAWE